MKKAILLLVILAGCKASNVDPEKLGVNDIIFGHFYGECMGEGCIEIYKLTDFALFEDTKDIYPTSGQMYNGDFQQLDNSLFEKVKDLNQQIPSTLIDIDENVIGMPDAGDWGGIYVQINYNGGTRYWLIDKMQSNIPENLRPFVSEVESKIALINGQ
jgi:hypothetical protein